MTDVQGRCPACRGASLFLGSGGYVTCRRLDCRNPTAADQLLHGEQTTGYCPACGRGDVAPTADEYEKQRQRAERAEAVVTQVRQLLATGQVGCCAHLVRAALDQPAPAAAEATEPREHCGDLKPQFSENTARTECVLRPGHTGSHADHNSTRWWWTDEAVAPPEEQP